MISLNKRLLPKYLYKLNVALICFFAVWFGAGVPLMVTIGCIYDENVITYAVMIATFAAFFIGLAIFVIIDIKLHSRYIKECAAELEKEFIQMPFDEAERILKERGTITDNGFCVSEKVLGLGGETVPFDRAWLTFDAALLDSKIRLHVTVFLEDDYIPKTVYDLDCAVYSFLLGKDTNLKDNDYFNLFVKDKSAFAALVLKGVKAFTFNYRNNF